MVAIQKLHTPKKYTSKLQDGRIGDEINKQHFVITNY